MQYKRLGRSATPTEMWIHVKGVPDRSVWVQLRGSMLQETSIETLQPQPVRVQSQGKAMLVEVATDKAGMATLHLTVRSEDVGRVTGQVRAGANSAVRVSTFLYP